MLGARLEQSGRPVEAIDLYCRALTGHPRYSIALYRLGMALNMLSQQRDVWNDTSTDRQRVMVSALKEAATSAGIELPNVEQLLTHSIEDSETGRSMFQEVAEPWFSALLKSMRLRARVPATLRRSERAIAVPHLQSHGRWGEPARLRWLAKTGLMMAGAKCSEKRIQRRAKHRLSWWQLSYNLACHSARTGQPDQAMEWLERCLARPGVDQLTFEWAQADPDLATLRYHPRFDRFCSQLHKED
jgi:tetratricopeptide (TPR) repeat protein